MYTDFIILMVLTTAIAVGCVLLGYWMGRNSTERPMISEAQPPLHKDQGSKDEPEYGDLFRDAMAGQEDGRIATVKE